MLVTIPSGANAKTIGALLARRHLVRRALGFVLAARLEGVADKMQAGHYEISPAMPPRQIAALIALGKTANDIVTIPEGYTVAQIARRLAAAAHGGREEVSDAGADPGTDVPSRRISAARRQPGRVSFSRTPIAFRKGRASGRSSR